MDENKWDELVKIHLTDVEKLHDVFKERIRKFNSK